LFTAVWIRIFATHALGASQFTSNKHRVLRVLYAVVCENAESRDDGRIDAYGIFHQLYAPAFPARQDQMVLVVNVEWTAAETGRNEFRIDLLDPSGSPAITISGHTDVGEPQEYDAPPQSRIIIPLEDVVFPIEGTYEFELHSRGERIGVAPLYLVKDPGAS
jgi:hypothetical protein